VLFTSLTTGAVVTLAVSAWQVSLTPEQAAARQSEPHTPDEVNPQGNTPMRAMPEDCRVIHHDDKKQARETSYPPEVGVSQAALAQPALAGHAGQAG